MFGEPREELDGLVKDCRAIREDEHGGGRQLFPLRAFYQGD